MNSYADAPASQHHLRAANDSGWARNTENFSAQTAFGSFPCYNENSFLGPIMEDEERLLEEEEIGFFSPPQPTAFGKFTPPSLTRECICDEEDLCGLTPNNNDNSTDPIVTLMSCASPNTVSPQEMSDRVLRYLPPLRWNADPVTDALVRNSMRSQKQWENVQALFFSDRYPSPLASPPLALTWHGMPATDGSTTLGKRKREECILENENEEGGYPLSLRRRKPDDLFEQHSKNLPLSQSDTSISKMEGVKKEGAAWGNWCMRDDDLRQNGATKICYPSGRDEKIDSFASLMDSLDKCDSAKLSAAAESRKDGRQCTASNIEVELLGKKRCREYPVVEMNSFGRRMEK